MDQALADYLESFDPPELGTDRFWNIRWNPYFEDYELWAYVGETVFEVVATDPVRSNLVPMAHYYQEIGWEYVYVSELAKEAPGRCFARPQEERGRGL